MGDLASAQNDWINRMKTQASDLLPEKNRPSWRSFTLKLRRSTGTGIQLSMRLRNAMGIERPVEPNPAAQAAAKELHALYEGFGQTKWDLIEVRFSCKHDSSDESKPAEVFCSVYVDPDKQAKKA